MFYFLTFVVVITTLFASGSGQSCTEGEVRLVGGQHTLQGRLEVCTFSEFDQAVVWGTVCNDGWDELDAQVVCSQLGVLRDDFPNIIPIVFFGAAEFNVTILFGETNCIGNETQITQCPRNIFSSCVHEEDVGIICSQQNPECSDGQVRLLDSQGSNSTEGRVETCVGGIWGTICGTNWSDKNSDVVCRQLGHETTAPKALSRVDTPSGDESLPILLDFVKCSGSERSLAECDKTPVVDGCAHVNNIGVNCTQPNGAHKNKAATSLMITLIVMIAMTGYVWV